MERPGQGTSWGHFLQVVLRADRVGNERELGCCEAAVDTLGAQSSVIPCVFIELVMFNGESSGISESFHQGR